jgi:hypothetical protein
VIGSLRPSRPQCSVFVVSLLNQLAMRSTLGITPRQSKAKTSQFASMEPGWAIQIVVYICARL